MWKTCLYSLVFINSLPKLLLRENVVLTLLKPYIMCLLYIYSLNTIPIVLYRYIIILPFFRKKVNTKASLLNPFYFFFTFSPIFSLISLILSLIGLALTIKRLIFGLYIIIFIVIGLQLVIINTIIIIT